MTVRTTIHLLIVILAITIISGCSDDKPTDSTPDEPADILVRLQALPGVEVTEITPAHDYCERQFELMVTQPVDHDNPGGQTFQQQVFLSHQSDSTPMVLVTGGYLARDYYYQELGFLLEANQIYTGYRYFEGSCPEPPDWTHLRLAQAASDIHEIVELLKPIYTGTWISAGHSKSGRTALVHRRFYPDDVVATVAYVAGIPEGQSDFRYLEWLNSVGTEQCREDQKNFQRLVLLERDSIETLLQNWYETQGETNTLDPGIILEWLVTEYRFTTWQDGSANCNNIPDATASPDELFEHLVTECWHAFMYSDRWRVYYYPWHYEVATETGGFIPDIEHIQDLLVHVTGDHSDLVYLCPPGVDLTYHADVLPDLKNWLESSGDNIIYIYGGLDYVTAAAVNPGPTTNALRFIHPGGGHGTMIYQLAERDVVLATLEQWTGLEFPPYQVAPSFQNVTGLFRYPGFPQYR